MLQAIRSKAETYIVKILFALLTATFALWGIGDIFRNWGTDTSVAKVGSQEITTDQVGQEARAEMDQLRSTLGTSIDADQAKQLGVVDAALERIVGGVLLDLETQRLKLLVGDEAVRQAIVNDPNFKGQQGGFDRDRYTQLLAANHMSEADFENSVRSQLVRSQLTDAVSDGMSPPPTMIDALYRARAERRIADVVTLTPAAIPVPPAPTDDQIAAYYAAHKDAFRQPEQRAITVATLNLDDVASTIAVPDDKLKSEYDSRRDEFATPEQREIRQMLLPDEATANAAEAQLDAGKDFTAVAKTQAKADAASTDLGWVKHDDLPTQLANVAFALPKGKPSNPVQTSFGWHILLVTDIKAAQTQSLDSVRTKLTREIQRDEAGDAIAKIANNIDDAMAGGLPFTAVVQKFGLKTLTVPVIDAQGRGASGKPVDLPQPSKGILQAAFSSGDGETSQLSELGDDGYFIVHVDKVTPAEVRPLTEARGDVVAHWQADQKKDALEKLAAAIVGDVNGGRSLKDVAAARKLATTTTTALARTGGDPATPPALVAALFDAKPNGAVSAPAGGNFVVAQLKSVEPADPSKDPAAVKQLTDQIAGEMKTDMLGAFSQTLRANFPVQINQANLDHVL
ncbi:MAG TPA: SurA N-terminal domain-containing protein [Stellaceae bacterium]|nr:SurA N-terminal domain-containing protein [Stellaceae bacterium]